MAVENEPRYQGKGSGVDEFLKDFQEDKPVGEMTLEELDVSTRERSTSADVQGVDGVGEAVERQVEEVAELHDRLSS